LLNAERMKLQPSLVLMIASVALLGPACSSRGPDDALGTTFEALTPAAGEATSGLVRTFLNGPATTLPDAQIVIQALENDGAWLCWGLTTDSQGMPMHGEITLGSCEGWINPSSGYYRNAGAFLRTVNFGDGTFELHAAAASGCVDIQDGPTGNGTVLQLADCNGTLRQRFSYVPVNASGGGTFGQFKHVASQKCIDTEWGGTAGTRLRLWECNKGTNGEAWRPNAGSLDFNRFNTGLPDGPFRFGASLSKYGSDLAVCMDVVNASSASGTPIQLWPCNTTSAQRFTVHNVGEGVFELNVLGKCVDIRNGAMADHTALQIWDCNGTPAQRFRWGGDLCTADRAFCIDRPNNTKANGTELQIYHRNSTYAQGWNSELVEPPACSWDRCFVWPDKWGSYNGFTTAPLQQTGKGVNDVRFQMACTENEQTLHESRAVYRSPNGGVTWDPIGYWPEACLGTIRSFIDHDTPLIANDTVGTTT
jgi:hypothetical protein